MLFKNSTLFACCVGAVVVVPATAEAADLGPYRPPGPAQAYIPPPPPGADPILDGPVFHWTGAYWGLSAGYGWGESTQKYDRAGDHGLAFTEPEGALGALTLGYNYQTSSGLTVGIEGDVGILDISAADKVVYDGHVMQTAYGPWWGTIRGRLGISAGHTLFYGTGGAAFMDVDEVSVGNTPGETAVNEDFRSGWVAGAGIEHALGHHMTIKLEYLHMDFGKTDGLSPNGESFSFENEVDLVRAGINYKF